MTSNGPSELQLLENVMRKLVLCDTDAKLEKVVGTFLPPVLLKFASPDKQARDKVVEILAHLNKRITPNKEIRLPFDALLSQLIDDNVPSSVKEFTLIYIDKASSRLPCEELVSYIPKLLRNIASRPTSHQITLLHTVLPVLGEWKLEREKQKAARQDIFGFDDHPADLALILEFFMNILMFQPVFNRQGTTELAETIIPGLSRQSVAAVTYNGKMTWSSPQLLKAKLGILQFILTDIFKDTERFRLLLAGVVNHNDQIVTISEDGLRRWTTKVDLEDPATIESLYDLYLGTQPPSGSATDRSPASIPLKLRLLQYLCKSITATNMATRMIDVVSDGIHGASSTLKLRQQSLQFLHWTARMCKEESISPLASELVSSLLSYIDQNPNVSGRDEESIKGSAYATCGLILRKVPKVALYDTHIISTFFELLEVETRNMRVHIQDALNSMIYVYTDVPEDSPIYQDLQDIILKAVEKKDSQCRYMALKYANSTFPFSCVFARYVCLLGTASFGGKPEVADECKRGLHPFVRSKSGLTGTTDKVVPSTALPSFGSLVDYISTHRPGSQFILNSKSPIIRGYPAEVYSNILQFLRTILILEANPTNILIDENVETKVNDGMTDDPIAMDNFKELMNNWWADDSDGHRLIEKWVGFVENAFDIQAKDPLLLSIAAKCLLEVISLGPSSISAIFVNRLSMFKEWVFSDKDEARLLMSHIFGIIASDESVPRENVETMLSEFCDKVEQSDTKQSIADSNRKHGAILAIGYLLGRCSYRNRTLSEDVVRRCIDCLLAHLEGTPNTTFMLLTAAASQALAEIGRACELPLPNLKRKSECITNMEEGDAETMDVDIKPNVSTEDVIEKLVKLVKTCKNSKVQEKAILALGHLSIPMDNKNALVNMIVDALYASADTKQVELFFAGGEAWSAIAFGWDSQAMRKYKDISDMPTLTNCSKEKNELVQVAIEKIIRSFITSDREWYRKAACIWLLSILKFGKDHPLIKTNLGAIHASFSRLLGDRDSFTQEVASKGLGLVYEYGDEEMKKDMVQSLVGTFTEGRKVQAQSITDNTVLFEEGTFGTTPDGGSISTYKELCSLASELNQPDLVYRFMNLANDNTMWSSRQGAAFGIQNLMSLAEKEMEPYLSKLIPKLYRYKFDPNSRVSRSMKAIWDSLVKDTQKNVDAYFNEIIEDLLSGLGSRQWRIREASACAITELISGPKFGQIEPYLERLWQMSFRALDDIKESVRKAATMTCKSLANRTVDYCNPDRVSMSEGVKVVNIVIPFLLEKGIVSSAEDVRNFSLKAVLNLCETSGKLLKAYIPELIDTLLQSLSALEPQVMSYLSFHTESYNISQEQLDNVRLSGAKNSPMMEGIERCAKYIDEEVMEKISPRIVRVMKESTGLPTKAGCARFIVTLCMDHRSVFEPFADTFLKTLSGLIRSNNPATRKTYATAAGYVCQLATQNRIVSYIKHLKKLYIDEPTEDSQAASAVATMEMTRYATDKVKAVASELVPLIYFGEHDPDDGLKKLWKDAWENLTSGIRSMVVLHADEIIAFTEPLLSSASWNVRQTAALTIADMCKSENNGIQKHIGKLMPAMESTLAQRTWAGKEHVLDAFVQLCISVPDYFQSDNRPSLEDAVKIMAREAQRKNRLYQRHALASLTKFSNAFSEKIDMFDKMQEFLTDLTELDENNAMEDDEHDGKTKALLLMIKANAFAALTASFRPKVYSHQAEYAERLCQTLTSSLEGSVWNVKVAIMNSLKVFVEQANEASLTHAVVLDILNAYDQCMSDMKYKDIRTSGISVLEAVAANVKDENKRVFMSHIESSILRETDPLLKERLQKLKREYVE